MTDTPSTTPEVDIRVFLFSYLLSLSKEERIAQIILIQEICNLISAEESE